MSATGRGADTEPGRALRAPTGPGAVLAATDGGERVCFSSPLGSQCGGCSSLRTPGPLRSTGGHAPLRWVLRSWPPACPSALPAEAKNGWTGLDLG